VVAGGPDQLTLVGRIEEVNDNTSKVLLVTDLVSAISVGVVGKPDLGLLEGRNRPWCVMRYLPGDTTVAAGDEIISAGLGGVFPPGVPVGKVMDVMESDDGFFKSARVKPLADFGSIREVMVLNRK
jgi:rod shape-determining protein MreC